MSGVSLKIDVDDREILAALRQLQAVCNNLTPTLGAIGEYLGRSHEERFRQQVDPNGNPWVDTSPVTKARKSRNKDKILIESEDLMSTLRYKILDNALEFGTDRIYGAMMQFGGTKAQYPNLWGDIPARPYLGISSTDKTEILDILSRHILARI